MKDKEKGKMILAQDMEKIQQTATYIMEALPSIQDTVEAYKRLGGTFEIASLYDIVNNPVGAFRSVMAKRFDGPIEIAGMRISVDKLLTLVEPSESPDTYYRTAEVARLAMSNRRIAIDFYKLDEEGKVIKNDSHFERAIVRPNTMYIESDEEIEVFNILSDLVTDLNKLNKIVLKKFSARGIFTGSAALGKINVDLNRLIRLSKDKTVVELDSKWLKKMRMLRIAG